MLKLLSTLKGVKGSIQDRVLADGLLKAVSSMQKVLQQSSTHDFASKELTHWCAEMRRIDSAVKFAEPTILTVSKELEAEEEGKYR